VTDLRRFEEEERIVAWIRRQWTPDAAQHWTKEDLLAAVLSALSYGLIIIGGTLSLLADPAGYLALAAGIVLAGLMYWVIDPKLRAVSTEYEKRQAQFLERLEDIARWEERE